MSKEKSRSHSKPDIDWAEEEVYVTCNIRGQESCVFVYHKFNSTVLLVKEYSSETQFPQRLLHSDSKIHSVAAFTKIEGKMEPEPLTAETFFNRSPVPQTGGCIIVRSGATF